MNPAFNPQPTYPFCTEQYDMFCFITKHGFAAVDFDDVQGLMADSDLDTLAQFGSKVFVKSQDVCYPAVESVPDLVARYADMKKHRAAALALGGNAPATKPGSTPLTWKK